MRLWPFTFWGRIRTVKAMDTELELLRITNEALCIQLKDTQEKLSAARAAQGPSFTEVSRLFDPAVAKTLAGTVRERLIEEMVFILRPKILEAVARGWKMNKPELGDEVSSIEFAREVETDFVRFRFTIPRHVVEVDYKSMELRT